MCVYIILSILLFDIRSRGLGVIVGALSLETRFDSPTHLRRHALHAHHALQHCLVRVVRVVALVDDPRAVDDQHVAAQLDVLPHLGLSGDGGHTAHFLAPVGVYWCDECV